MKQERSTHLQRVCWLLALVSASGLLAACGRQNQKPAKAQEIGGNGGVPVTVATAVQRDIAREITVTGSLVPLNDVLVGPRAGGKISAVHVREGDAVSAGQIVAVMELTDYQAQLETARANLNAALTRQAQAQALAEQARNQLAQAELNLDVTDKSTAAALSIARSTLAQAQETLSVVRQGARPQEREQAEQQVRAARANVEKLRSDLKRMQELYKDQAISTSQLEQVQAAYDAAEANYRAAQEALSLIKEGARKEDIRKAELAVEQAQEALRKAEADRRLVELRKNDVANARAAVRSADEGVRAATEGTRQARAALTMAQNALSNAYVRSPVSGYVAARMAEPGQTIGGGTPIVRIVAPGSVYFQASVSESAYADLAVGQPVRVTVDALPGKVYRGRITRIFPVASAAARSFTVRIDFQGDGDLRPQMFARGEISVGVHRNATLVPKDAVLFGENNGDSRVFVVEAGDKASERRVRVGFANPEHVEIVEGVKPGERVVVAGQNNLRDGARVTVR